MYGLKENILQYQNRIDKKDRVKVRVYFLNSTDIILKLSGYFIL